MDFDILIVGGGIVGTSLAYFLTGEPTSFEYLRNQQEVVECPVRKATPLKVALLERQSLASEASGLSAGTLWNLGPLRLDGDIQFRGLATFRNLSSLLYQQIQSHVDIDYLQCGALQLAMTPAEEKYARAHVDQSQPGLLLPLSYQFLPNITSVRSILPRASDKVMAATFSPLSGQVNGASATHALGDLARVYFSHCIPPLY